jgi:hypothetical protein
MKTYTFFLLSTCFTVSVTAAHKFDARETVAHQHNIKNLALIKCLGINLPEHKIVS